jgi:hypothetical protein
LSGKTDRSSCVSFRLTGAVMLAFSKSKGAVDHPCRQLQTGSPPDFRDLTIMGDRQAAIRPRQRRHAVAI